MAFLTEKTASPRPSKLLRLLLRWMPPSVSYRPERHYMRGPGPKYRARHTDHMPQRRNG
jgi:hypothetical protein